MRLIDADALQNILLTIATALEHEYGSLGGAVSGCMKHIDLAQTVDAVPVVRCKDCARCVTHKGVHICNKWRTFQEVELDGFCSYAERKEGADND